MTIDVVSETFYLAVEADGFRRSKPPADTIPPSVPGRGPVTILSSTSASVQISTPSVDSQSGLGGYYVWFRVTGGDPTWIPGGSAGPAATSVLCSGLLPSTGYDFSLSAFDAAFPSNESTKSTVGTGTTNAAPAATWPANWPICQSGYQIGATQAEQLGVEPYRGYHLDNDAIVYQMLDIRSQSIKDAEEALLAYFDTNAVHPIRKMPYRILNTEAKTTTSGTATGWITTLLDSADGVANWRVRDAANHRLEHHFSPNTQYVLNEAVLVAGLNGRGEHFGEALARFDNELCSTGTNPLNNRINGRYLDDTNPIPGPTTWLDTSVVPNVHRATSYDYDNDGSNDSGGNTVGANDFLDGNNLKHAKGIVAMFDAYEAEFPGDEIMMNSARWSFDWTDGSGFTQASDPGLPLSTHPFYRHFMHGMSEFAHTKLGVMNSTCGLNGSTFAGGGTPGSFHYRYRNWATCWRELAMQLCMMRPDTASRRFFNFLDVALAYRKNGGALTADENEFLRLYTVLPLMHARLGIAVQATKREPITCDESLLELGAPIGEWSMGTLNETTLVFTVRPRNLLNGSAQFWWQEFEKGLALIRGDYTGTSDGAADPAGSAVACTLPSAGSGFHWERINSATYVNPITTRAMRGQDTTVNSGGTVTSISLKPMTARLIRRVAD